MGLGKEEAGVGLNCLAPWKHYGEAGRPAAVCHPAVPKGKVRHKVREKPSEPPGHTGPTLAGLHTCVWFYNGEDFPRGLCVSACTLGERRAWPRCRAKHTRRWVKERKILVCDPIHLVIVRVLQDLSSLSMRSDL